MLEIEKGLYLDERHLNFQFVRASGPGGQNVNKVSSAVHMRVRIDDLTELPLRVRNRLRELAGSKLTNDGEIIFDAQRHRTQERNKQDAIERFLALLRKAQSSISAAISTVSSSLAVRLCQVENCTL